MKNNAMIINRETAMSLWNKSFGKASKATDFAGREMVKAAYNDRNSAFGWNIDHILPQSKGGKTTESNLICCHILTNDEKADKFPCFTANGKRFEIVKVENHYEIREVGSNSNNQTKNSANDEINFFDSAAGIRFYKSLKGIQNKPTIVGTVIIKLNTIDSTAIIDFINEIFSDKSLSYSYDYHQNTIVTIKDYNMPTKEDISEMLDSCVLTNTYLSYYFKATKAISDYSIFYGVHSINDKLECLYTTNECSQNAQCPLVINSLVKINTEAKERISESDSIGRDKLNYDVYKYNYIFTKLAENLKKSIN